MQNKKRILSVRIIREQDTDPDTSYYGEYSNRATSEFSIDRRHSEDCESLFPISDLGKEWLNRILCRLDETPEYDTDGYEIPDAVTDVRDILENLLDPPACDCGGHQISSRELPYFNPSENYKGEPAEDVRKYVRQDYDRMESLNNGYWCYVGIRAEAEYVLYAKSVNGGYPIQTVTSGGLWGIESDSDKGYFAEVQAEKLSGLREQLKAIGFSTRAISTAFKSIEEVSR